MSGTMLAVAKVILVFVCLAFLVAAAMVAVVVIREAILWIRWKWRKKHEERQDDDRT